MSDRKPRADFAMSAVVKYLTEDASLTNTQIRNRLANDGKAPLTDDLIEQARQKWRLGLSEKPSVPELNTARRGRGRPRKTESTVPAVVSAPRTVKLAPKGAASKTDTASLAGIDGQIMEQIAGMDLALIDAIRSLTGPQLEKILRLRQ